MNTKVSLIRMRYILPVFWVCFELVGMFTLQALFPIVYLFSIPSMVIVGWINRSIYDVADTTHRDTTFYIFLGAVVQAFMLGLAIDLIVQRFKKRSGQLK